MVLFRRWFHIQWHQVMDVDLNAGRITKGWPFPLDIRPYRKGHIEVQLHRSLSFRTFGFPDRILTHCTGLLVSGFLCWEYMLLLGDTREWFPVHCFCLLLLSRSAFTSQYRHLPLLSQVALPFYLTHQQVFQNNCNLISSSGIKGACGDSFGDPLGAIPRCFPMYPGLNNHRSLPHFPSHHQAGPY